MFKKLLIPVVAALLLLGFAVPVAAAAPGAPTGLTLTAGVDSIDVSWTAPADDGGGTGIDNYVVDLTGVSTAQQLPAGTSATFSSLAPGAYSVSVAAVNAGDVGAAVSGNVTVVAAPSAPTGVTATVVGQTVTIDWTASDDDGGDPNIFYTVSFGAESNGTDAATSLQFTDVAPGTYIATVDAANTGGTSASGSSAEFTVEAPATPPSAPQNAVASVDGTTVNLTWEAPLDDGGDPPVSYTVALSGQADQLTTDLFASFPSLAAGDYTATITASNAAAGAGGSVNSNTVTVAAPATAPGVPTGLSATPSGTSAAVSWVAPASDGGSGITGYTLTVDGVPQAETGTSANLTGLTPGSHTVSVAAINAVGTGPATADVVFTIDTPVSAPSAPTGVSGSASGQSVDVSWTASASDGGDSNITYTVTLSPGGASDTTTGTTLNFPSVAPGDYTASVTATNGGGTSAPGTSASFTVDAPISAPSAVQNASASVTDQTITVTWDAPASDGGDANITYEVTIPGLTPQSGTALTETFTGVPAGNYTATIRGTNSGGQSPTADTNQVTVDAPTQAPGVPTGVTAILGAVNGEVSISWTAPASNGGAPIDSYTVTLNGEQSFPTGTEISFSDLSPGSYTVTVAATNAAGTGAASSPATFDIDVPITAPGTPGNVNASVSGQTVTVNWTAPENGGDPDIFYNVSIDGGTPSVVTGTSTQIGGVAAGSHTVSVTATNSAGTSGAGTDTFQVFTAPSAPRSLAAAADGSTVIATWAAPASNGNQPITSYEVSIIQNGNALETKTVSADVSSIEFTGRGPGVYTIQIRAQNSSGFGPTSTADVEVGSTAPSAPTSVSGSAVFQTVTVTWDPPLSAGNSPLTGYEITVGTVTQEVDAGTRSVVLADIEPGTYVAEVRAINSGGAGLSGTSGPFKAETVFSPFESANGLISQQYLDFLGREADAEGLEYWEGILGADRNQGPIVIENFMRSAEFAPRRSVARLYLAFFDRAPDRSGFDFWAGSLSSGGELNDIAAAFADSDEFRNTYGELNDAEFIALVYNNVLLRQPDLEGFRFWLDRMQDPNISRGDLMVAFSESAEFKRNSAPAVDVIMTYRGMLDRAPEPAGFSFWVGEVAGRSDALQTLIFNFLVSEEYSNRVR